jgi:hypothetical protein
MRKWNVARHAHPVPRIGRGHDGRRGELRDRDVVRVPVRAVRTEGDDDVGTDASQVEHEVRDHLARVGPIQLAIAEREQRQVTHAEHGGRRLELGSPNGAEHVRSRVPGRVAMATIPPALTPRGGDQ